MFRVVIKDVKGEVLALLVLAGLVGMHLGYKLAKWANLDLVEFGWTDAIYLGVMTLLIVRSRKVFRWLG